MNDLQTITQKYQTARKIEGVTDRITLACGRNLVGRYILTEAGAATASHDVRNGFAPSEGFPVDAEGGTVNDRDYERDKDAQAITRKIAAEYDARAIQSPVIVSRDGVVLSGNGRTMAGELAAMQGTDGIYIAYLREAAPRYGFTPEQVDSFDHPRLLFQTDHALPYTATTFAMFNAQEMKGQSKTEQAVKLGKLVGDDTFSRIVATVNGFETLSDFYSNTEAATFCLGELLNAGIISSMQYAEYVDGESVSAAGRELLENVLIGKVFSSSSDCVRMTTSYKSLRRSCVLALGELANNFRLSSEYSLISEVSEAIALCYQARKEGDYKDGEKVSEYARQRTIFDGSTVADFRDDVMLFFADVLNGKKDSQLKRLLALYNHEAKAADNREQDMFSISPIRTKKEILTDVIDTFKQSSEKEQKEAVRAVVTERVNNNAFVSQEQLTSVKKGSYVEYMCGNDVIVCQVERVKGSCVFLFAKGGCKITATRSQVRPTAGHRLSLPSWLHEGSVIHNPLMRQTQKIESISDGSVVFEWINGGCLECSIERVLTDWRPSTTQVCQVGELERVL